MQNLSQESSEPDLQNLVSTVRGESDHFSWIVTDVINGYRVDELMTRTYTLNIFDETKSKDYSLKYPGSKTVEEVKGDVYSLTDIPVRYQAWMGWPSALRDDSVTLAAAGLNHPCHVLRVSRNPNKEFKRVSNIALA